jgi:hypothetical protein
MSEQAPDRVWSGIDIPKTIAGALAAVCAAVIGSFLGVAGTLVGAAVASIIGSVGTEVYQRSLHKGAKRLQTLAVPAFVKAPAAVGTPAVAAASEEDSPSHTVPEKPQRQIRWGRVAMIAGALFVLAMGTLTVTELILGKSVASTVGNGTGAKTTFGGLLNPGSSSDTKPTPAPSPTPTTAATEDPATQPTTQASPDAPTTTTEPTTQPTTAPTTAAPAQTAPADTSGGGQNVVPGQGGQNVVPGQGGQSTP